MKPVVILNRLHFSVFIVAIVLWAAACREKKENNDALFNVMANTTIVSNIPYVTHDLIPVLLDVYLPIPGLGEPPWLKIPNKPAPTLLYFHGGGWSQGDRSSRCMLLLPYLQKGWNVVSADYKLAGTNGIQDCFDDSKKALEWIYQNAAQYSFDTTRIVLSGESAGGHLAMLVGLTASKSTKSNISGIINWYGVTDMEKAVAFWNDSTFANVIYGKKQDRKKMNEDWSPIHHLDADTPPIITIHGDADVNIPIDQAILLHNQLDKLHLQNRLIRIGHKKHGNFSQGDYATSFKSVFDFIKFE